MKVLIAAPVDPVLANGLAALGYECIFHEQISQRTAPDFISECAGVVTSTRLHLDRTLIDAAPELRWIGRLGSGMEIIDVAYATEKGIVCLSSPEGNCNAVAEHAVGLLLGLTKRVRVSSNEVAAGQWLREENRGIELEGRTIGIIGLGHTGLAFAHKLQGFDMRILGYDSEQKRGLPPYLLQCDLERIYAEADIVSFHVPLAQDTVHYFDEAFAAGMQKPFLLLNTSRGAVVKTSILYELLQQKKLLGAGLDVLEEEPLKKMSATMRAEVDRLLACPEILITPHIAGYSVEALFKMSHVLLEKIRKYT